MHIFPSGRKLHVRLLSSAEPRCLNALITHTRFIVPTWVEFYQRLGSSVSKIPINYTHSHLTIVIQLSVEVANTTSAALDGLIASSMIFLLHRSKTGYKR